MKVILLDTIKGSGKKYEVKEVSDGYAMNFLLPNKLAERATPERIKKIEELKEGQFEAGRVQEELLEKDLETIHKVQLEIQEKASEKGVLFKGITPAIIVKELKSQVHIDFPVEALVLEKPIKEVGEHTVNIVVGEHKTSFKVVVTAQ
ncbi:MAG: 50S ribosomal protein L9 [Candidatus Paceibacterota bacterium]